MGVDMNYEQWLEVLHETKPRRSPWTRRSQLLSLKPKAKYPKGYTGTRTLDILRELKPRRKGDFHTRAIHLAWGWI